MKRIHLILVLSLFFSISSFSQKVIKHKIKSGESILGLAIKYGVSEKDIYELNPKTKGALLQLNQELRIPNKKFKEKEKPSKKDKKEVVPEKNKKKDILILNNEQKELLVRAKNIAGEGSLIPPEKSYKEWLATYEKATNRAGFAELHGLRHFYAQQRFEAIAGFKAPTAGGPKREELTADQIKMDYKARMIVSEELGHGREEVTVNYLGR